MFTDFRKRETEGKRKREKWEKHKLVALWPGIKTTTYVCMLIRNWTYDLSIYGLMLQSSEPHWLRLNYCLHLYILYFVLSYIFYLFFIFLLWLSILVLSLVSLFIRTTLNSLPVKLPISVSLRFFTLGFIFHFYLEHSFYFLIWLFLLIFIY